MEQFSNNVHNSPEKTKVLKAGFVVMVCLAVFLGAQAIGAIKNLSYIGRGVVPSNVINVTGSGEVMAVPDTGTFSFSVTESGKVASDAQAKASTKTNTILSALRALGVAEKDIKTVGYNSYPKYEWQNASCPRDATAGASGVTLYCPPGKQILTGYEVSQTISVKIRKTEDSGTILAKVGDLGATNISGLNFVVDDPDAVQAEARDKAIADAKAQAKVLAKSLGVRLVRIVNLQEYSNGGGPIYYAMDAKATGSSAPVPEIPVGENKVTSNVTLTYEIE